MTAPTSAKVGRHSLAQWMALCAAVLVLPGCGGGGGSGGSAEAPRTVNFLQAAQALSADPDEFERRKRAFEDHEYEPVIWGRTDYTGPRGLDYGHGDYGWRLLSEPTYAECQRKPEECWAPHADNSRRLINASSAYARGATGKGEVVAVYDTGISDNQSEFDAVGKNGVRTGSKVTVTKTYDDHLTDPTAVFVHNAFIRHPVFNNSQSGSFLDPYEHGTAVAAVIAARRDGREGYAGISAPVNYKSNMHGVAFDAALYVHAVGLNPLTSLGLPSNLSDWTEEHDKQSAARYFDLGPARKAGAAIVNQSFGYGIGGDGKTRRDIAGYLPEGTSPRKAVAYLRGKLKYNVAAMAQWGVPDAEKIIIVRAAGNSGAQKKLTPTSPGLISGLHAAIPELRGHVLSAVAVDQKGDLAWFSNPCGIAKDFCLAAPGVNLLVPYPESRDSKDDYGKKIPTFPAEKNLEIYTRFNGWFNDLIQENPHDRGLFSAPPDQPYYITQKYAEWVNNHLRVTGYYPASGTSLSAPLVSGGLALLRQFFRVDYADGTSSYQLGNTELVARLLKTANKTGRYADSDKYGQGLMDLDAATDPVGQLMTSLSDDPNARPFDGGGFAVSGGAFGAAMRDALGGVKIAAFDQLDAPFFFSVTDNITNASRISGSNSDTVSEHEVLLSDTVSSASLALSVENGTPLSARIRRGNLWFSYGHHGGREAGLYFGDDGGNAPENFGMNFSDENSANTLLAARHFRAPLAFASPYLSLVRDGPGLGWSQPLRSGARLGFSLMHGAPQFDHFQNPGGARGLGALFDFRPNNTSLSLQAGAVREADGFLGARAQGNFGEISADTAFAGIGGDWAALQNWRLLASAYLGHTKADAGGGMLRAADDIVSSAFSLGLARASLARRGDWLGLRLSQPLRAESGAAHLHIPAGRTKYREVIHRAHKVELTPSGRNLQVEAEYRVPFAGGNLRAGLGFDRHANHDRARDLETFLRLGFERRF